MNSRLLLVLVVLMGLGVTLAACATEAPTVETIPTEVALPTEAPLPTEVVITQPLTTTQPLTLTGGITTTAGVSGTLPTGPATLMMKTDATLGDYVTDGNGRTLYLFTDDTDGKSTCTEPTCMEMWPPLLTLGTPVAGSSDIDAAKLGTTLRDNGQEQVTYNNHPLYYYYEDKAPGDVLGQALQEKWYLVSPAGEKVE